MNRKKIRQALFRIVILLAGMWISPLSGRADETQNEPTPSSVNDVVVPMDNAYTEKQGPPPESPWLKSQLQNTPPFLRDTKLDLNVRSYYFNKNNYDGSKNEAWALGGALSYKSGWLMDRFALGAVLYTSQPLYAPQDTDGTKLLLTGQQGYTVLGEAYGRIKLADAHYVNLFRYEYNTPYINKDDSRMSPKTFEGYTFQGALGKTGDKPTWQYGGGYITKIKERNSDEFVWMSQGAGAPIDRGVVAGGGIFTGQLFSIGMFDYYCEDVLNIAYGEAKTTINFTDQLGLLAAVQFTDQRSVGDNLLKGTSFSTNQFGVKTDLSFAGSIFTVAYTQAADGADLQKPWSSYPGYTSSQIFDYNRANEKAVLVKASYDFTRLGLDGVTAYALYVDGWDRVSTTPGKSVSDEYEFDFDLQWKAGKGALKGFWPRIRYAIANEEDGAQRSIHEIRIILNYDFSIL
jgi:hypothetical protein